MSRTLTPKDGAAIMNLLVKQATGQQSITVVDESTFVSAGETVLATGMENVFNSLNIVLAKTLIAVRAYKANLTLMDAINSGVYSNRLRKISYYSGEALNDGDHNTDLFTNLKDGFTAGQNESDGSAQSTKSQWEQNQKAVLEMNFGGSTVWQHAITLYEDQLQVAFQSSADFAAFVAGYLTEHESDIESAREAWNRMVMLNLIGQTYDMSSVKAGSVINLTAAYNAKYGTSYTSAQLRSTYLKEFAQFFTSEFKKASRHMTERSVNYHWSPAASDGSNAKLLRHVPYADQRVYLFSDIWDDVRASVYSEIFNPSYLDINTQYQEVGYWQSEDDRAAIKCIPAVVNTSTGIQEAGTEVDLPYVVGVLCDKDAMVTDFQLEVARTTPVEARKGYRTTWLSIAKNAIVDPTEDAIIFIMAD